MLMSWFHPHIRAGVTLAVLFALIPALLTPSGSFAQTPEAFPFLPQGPLGEQVTWLLDILNGDPAAITVEEMDVHFAPEFLRQVPSTQLASSLTELRSSMGPFTIEEDAIATTMDLPPTNARFVLVGTDGIRLETAIAIDRETGLITGLVFQPAPEAPADASPEASPALPTGIADVEVTFESGGDTIVGSLMTNASITAPGTSALIISGSGPTDRNGNSGQLTAMNTNLNLANLLAGQGITSLRYDKLGSGETGPGARTSGDGVDYILFLQEARDAAAFLRDQPMVDPNRLILVGHSEGAIFALALAQELSDAGTPPAAVILVSPISIRYLDLLVEQLNAQLDNAVVAGQISQDEADAGKQEIDEIVESLRTSGEVPETIVTPGLDTLFNTANAAFLAQIDAVDPAAIAAGLPPALPVLVLLGEKDEQVTAGQVDHLMTGFGDAGNDVAQLVVLPNVNHLMKVVEGDPNAALDYANPELPFSPEAVAAIEGFLGEHDLANPGGR